ncbi:extracellular solute-binding protein [Pengzhenrongella sp.]|jgi:raffinose/stachyose/melibiose transport system substrate-binding protein|uniref:extracellular solute-binding protein n=1 Tax=Pengzhenrongella sp. TaxID=2888820 RepID=UPI002F93940A
MKLTKLRQATAAVTIATLATALAACGSSGPTSGAAGSAGASAWALTGGDEQTFRTSFDAWNKTNPTETITPTFLSNDAFKQKVRTAIGAGKGPSLIYGWGGGILKAYVDAGQVADLTDDVNADPALKSRFLPSIAATGIIAGKVYAIGNNAMQPVVLFYNKDVFTKAGIEPPTTFDGLLAVIPKLKAAGVAPLALGGQSKWPDLMWEEYLVDRIGGPEVFDKIAANKPDAWSDPAVLEANTKIQQLVGAGAFVKGFSSIAADSGADLALLYTGKAAMLLQGSWNYPTLKTANPQFLKDGKLGFIPFPAVTGGKGDPKDVAGNPANFWSVSSKASAGEKKAALDYLKKGVMSDDYVDALLKGGAVPPVAGLQSKLAATQDPQWLSYVYALAQQAPHFQLSWDQALSPVQADALLTNLDKLFLTQITPEQFSTAMNKTVGK